MSGGVSEGLKKEGVFELSLECEVEVAREETQHKKQNSKESVVPSCFYQVPSISFQYKVNWLVGLSIDINWRNLSYFSPGVFGSSKQMTLSSL